MAISAFLCQGVFTIFQKRLYQCILVTFTLSLGSILLIKIAEEKKTVLARFGAICGLGAVFVICKILPRKIPGFDVDYGLFGVLAPVAVYLAKNKLQSIFCLTVCLIGIAEGTLWIQWLSLLTIPLLLLYSGQRGKWKMKWFFYLYYPAHLVAIYFADIILHG